jgi:hypothetical protein
MFREYVVLVDLLIVWTLPGHFIFISFLRVNDEGSSPIYFAARIKKFMYFMA